MGRALHEGLDYDELQAASLYYRRVHDLSVITDLVAGGVYCEIDNTLGAVVVPSRWGWELLHGLRLSMLAGPVIGNDSADWWTFLTTGWRPAGAAALADLRHAGVQVADTGSHVYLPASANNVSGPGWHWIQVPAPGLLVTPPQRVVVSIMRRALRRGHGINAA